jgi:hypothetical protein
MENGKPSNKSARGVDIPPTTRNFVFRTPTDVQEYVPHSGWEYGHVVVLQTYVLHIGCAYGPTVACGGPDPPSQNERQTVALERSLNVPSV